MPYTKLHGSIITSTIWLEDHTTLRVWIAMLAMSDAEGCVGGSVPGLAHIARVTVDECSAALAKFMGPDKDSRTKDHEGRRIEEIDGGWRLLNYRKHREHNDADTRREYERRRKADYRQRVRDKNGTGPESPPVSPKAEAEAVHDDDYDAVDKSGEAESARAHRESIRRREAIERAELQRRAATIPMRDPLAAVHDPDTVAIVATSPPAGSRAWGPSDAAEVHRQLQARGRAHVEAVVAFIRDSIEGRRRFPGRGGEFVPAEPRQWSVVWQHDGEPWTRWEQRYAEASASTTAPAARQGEQPSESETEPDPPDEELTDEARGRMAAMAQGLVDKLSGAKSVTDAIDVEAGETDDA